MKIFLMTYDIKCVCLDSMKAFSYSSNIYSLISDPIQENPSKHSIKSLDQKVREQFTKNFDCNKYQNRKKMLKAVRIS